MTNPLLDLRKQIGRTARDARRALKITQEEAANRINVSVEFYARIERGNSLPSIGTFARMVSALNVSADVLLGQASGHRFHYGGTGHFHRELILAEERGRWYGSCTCRTWHVFGETDPTQLLRRYRDHACAASDTQLVVPAPRQERIMVCSALFVNEEGLIFLQRREPNKRHPLLWETPGGKLEPGESHADALARELKEELNVEVPLEAIGEQIAVYTVQLDRVYEVILFPVDLPASKLRHRTLEGFRITPELGKIPDYLAGAWVDLDFAVQKMPCVPSLSAFYAGIKRYLAGRQ